jgi:hypothetical protein
MPPRRSKRRLSSQETEDESPVSQPRRTQPEESEDDDGDDDGDDAGESEFAFSQQAPEASQGVLPERANERRNLESMDQAARDKALTSLSRLVLFKALDREPVDRLKVVKDAGFTDKISSAAFQEASNRLRNVFGFELSRIPKYMEKMKGLPAKFKDRFYVLNGVTDTADGSHSKAIHSVHPGASIEKGLLLLILSLIFCKGESRSDGSRWILARDLYRLLHNVDDSIPEEPPAQGTARAKASTQKISRFSQGSTHLTPNVDAMLEQFVQWDYLIKDKATDDNFNSQTLEEGDLIYTMGPRSAMEVGRKQVICFCAEILDEEPDPTMLKEVEEELEEEDDEGYMEEAAQAATQ